MNQEQKILWYWSGEADDALSREVEELLETDAAARQYFDELGELAITLTDAEVPARREGLLDEVLEAEEKVVAFPQKTVWGAAAAFILAGVAVFLFSRGPNVPDGPGIVEVKPPAPVTTPKTTLSKRILTDSGSFRSSAGGLDDAHRQRVRWKKIRNQKTPI